ncbi:hypothetical protein [Streptomyces harbinensis]|uniref:ABC-2 type transport system permease protein n=1 Tax=Streptomyces harbinensis TaxID=1176198 RepID=A0A1I6SS98_9ACTN|nr:hypothetical protein [Streptomyces harbinensis]SFS79760.1 hypothetical protein SAMN05444716_104114 [Streptomyces harbinensis]
MRDGSEDLAGAPQDALRHLHRLTGPQRRAKRRGDALLLYGVSLIVAFWLVPYLVDAGRTAGTEADGGLWVNDRTAWLLEALPGVLPAALALALYGAARTALWRGPVRLPGEVVSWLLPTPVDRRRLLLPYWWAALARVAVATLLAGAAAGFLLRAMVPGGGAAWAPAVAAGAWGGLLTGLLAVAAGTLVERYEGAVARHGRWLFRTAAALVAVLGLAAAAGAGLLWSGPWGWAVAPLAAALGLGGAAWWPLAVLAGSAGTGWLLLVAHRAAGAIPAAALRTRTAAGSLLAASVLTGNLRQARAVVRDTGRPPARPPRLRLPFPRRPALLIPWRDATGLLRAPGRLVTAALWAALAVLLAHAGWPLAALIAGYPAAGALTEPARLDSDDTRRAGQLPYAPGTLALWHGALPVLLLAPALAAGGALLAVAAPALVGAALVSSYRGQVPPHVMIGVETPAGNTGPFQTALWYARGPLVTLALLAPVQGIPLWAALPWTLAVAAGTAGWVRRTVRYAIS